MNDTFAGRLRDLVLSPGRLMDHVGGRPRWWQAGLLAFVVFTVCMWFMAPALGSDYLEGMITSGARENMPAATWDKFETRLLAPTALERFGAAAAFGFVSWLTVIVLGLIFGFFIKMAGGVGTYLQAVGIVSWASLLTLGVGTVLQTPLVLAKGTFAGVTFSAAAFFPDLEPTGAAYAFLAAFTDLFVWWALVLTVIGFGRVFRLSRNAATVSIILPWALCRLVCLSGLLFRH